MTLNPAPVLCTAFVTGIQKTGGEVFVPVLSNIPAPLNGHCKVTLVPNKLALNLMGVVCWPKA